MLRSHILLVENEPADVLRLRRAIERERPGCVVHWARNGDQAIDFLCGIGEFSGRSRQPLPTLVLLDLSLPGISGFDLLAWLQAHPQLKSIPVVAVTRSPQPSEDVRAVALGARGCYLKTDDCAGISVWLEQFLPPPSSLAKSTGPGSARKRLSLAALSRENLNAFAHYPIAEQAAPSD